MNYDVRHYEIVYCTATANDMEKHLKTRYYQKPQPENKMEGREATRRLLIPSNNALEPWIGFHRDTTTKQSSQREAADRFEVRHDHLGGDAHSLPVRFVSLVIQPDFGSVGAHLAMHRTLCKGKRVDMVYVLSQGREQSVIPHV